MTCFKWCRTRRCSNSNCQKYTVASVVNMKIQNVYETSYFLSRHSDLPLKLLPFLWLVLTVLRYGAVCIEMLQTSCATHCLFHELNVNLVPRICFFAVCSNKNDKGLWEVREIKVYYRTKVSLEIPTKNTLKRDRHGAGILKS